MAKNIEYADFVDKFEAKKTTDDCYTPTNIYNAIVEYVRNTYNINTDNIVRPFYPGGDYKEQQYPDGCIVIDNPPFSIMSQIVRYYQDRGIQYFLFAPGLTLFNTAAGTANYVVTGTQITYANGANVLTGFVTSLGDHKVTVAGDLAEIIRRHNDVNIATKKLPSYEYPANVITSHNMNKLARQGINLRLDGIFTRKLDNQGTKAIYGGGFYISDTDAANRIQAEREANRIQAERDNTLYWELSPRELDIIKSMEVQ